MNQVTVPKLVEVIKGINSKRGATLKQIIRFWIRCISASEADKRDLTARMRTLIYAAVKQGLLKYNGGFYSIVCQAKTVTNKKADLVLTESEEPISDSANSHESQLTVDKHDYNKNNCRPKEDQGYFNEIHYPKSALTTNSSDNTNCCNQSLNTNECFNFHPHCIHSCLERSLRHLRDYKKQADDLHAKVKDNNQCIRMRGGGSKKRSSRYNLKRRCCRRFTKCKSCGHMLVENKITGSQKHSLRKGKVCVKTSQYEKLCPQHRQKKSYHSHSHYKSMSRKNSKTFARKKKTKEQYKKQRKKKTEKNKQNFNSRSPNQIHRSPSPLQPFKTNEKVGANGLERKDSSHSNPSTFKNERNREHSESRKEII